jgi:tRNA-dihydrouridine synthase
VEKKNNLDGMMPAQRAIGNPWILTPHLPDTQEIYDTIIQHLHLSLACEKHFKDVIATYDH